MVKPNYHSNDSLWKWLIASPKLFIDFNDHKTRDLFVKLSRENKMSKLSKLLVKDIASDENYFLKETASVIEAAKMMKNNNISSVIVVPEEGFYPIGIITERDIVQRIVAEGKSPSDNLKDYMTKPVLTVDPQVTLIDAMKKMRANDVKRLVVTINKELEGMISYSDIIKVSPELLEILSNKTNIECIEDLQVDDDENLPGICEICGAESEDLIENEEGLFVCEDCLE